MIGGSALAAEGESMVEERQIEMQQVDMVPYQAPSVATQGFLDVMSIIPTMMVLFFMVMMMSMMRGFMEDPEKARKVVGKALEYIPKVGPALGKAVRGE